MKRIELLDSFRCLAILMVIFDHYTSTFTKANTPGMYPHIAQSLYPYGDKYSVYFENGYLGVELFFMISGFVIYLTLEKTASFKTFISKRVLRLFPLLFVCSIITFSAPLVLDSAGHYLLFHRPAVNFFPSLTFSDLWMWNIIFQVHDKLHGIEYIDNAYWTLGIEMKFYIYIAVIYYFTSKKNFFKHWLYYTLGLICIYILVSRFQSIHSLFYLKNLLETTFFAKYIIYFSFGVLFYRLYEQIPVSKMEYFVICLSAILCIISFMPIIESMAMGIFSGLFLVFIYKPSYLSILRSKPILFIGLISYPLYLVHQNIGVLLINLLADTFKIKHSEIYMFPVIILMLLFAYLLHKYVEVPLGVISKKIYPKKAK